MKFSSETIGRLLASGRNYASSLIGFMTAIGLMTAAQSKTLGDSLGEIASGVNQIIHGATSAWVVLAAIGAPLVPLFARWASNSAKTTNQAAAVVAAVKEANGNPATQLPIETKAKILDAAASLPEVKDTPIKVGDPVLANAVPAANVVAR